MKKIVKVISRIVYEIIARHLPEDFFPLGGSCSKFRALLARNFTTFIGNNVMIDKNVHLGNDIKINDGTGIGKNCLIMSGTTIGKGCSIAPDVYIWTRNHNFGINRTAYGGFTKEVMIGNYVWIGVRTIILPGCQIGDNVVIGAGSVVTKNLASGGVYAGNPAKWIKNIEDGLSKKIKK